MHGTQRSAADPSYPVNIEVNFRLRQSLPWHWTKWSQVLNGSCLVLHGPQGQGGPTHTTWLLWLIIMHTVSIQSSDSASFNSLHCKPPAPVTALNHSHAPTDSTHTHLESLITGTITLHTPCSTAAHSSASPHSAGTYRHVYINLCVATVDMLVNWEGLLYRWT